MTKEKYPRVGVAILALSPENDGTVLVGKRGQGSKRGRGKLSIPGGALEMGESIIGCALRELKEETGLLSVRGTISQKFTEVVLEDTDEHWITFYVVVHTFPNATPIALEKDKCDGWEYVLWSSLKDRLDLYKPLAVLVNSSWNPFR